MVGDVASTSLLHEGRGQLSSVPSMDVTEFAVRCNCTSVWLLVSFRRVSEKFSSSIKGSLDGEKSSENTSELNGQVPHFLNPEVIF